MGMYHSTSGKYGFQPHWKPSFLTIPKWQLKKIMMREEELRMSEEIQQKYTDSDNLEHLRNVTINLQRRALLENGIIEDQMEEALNVLHNARFMYQHDPDMNNITIYQRKDRSREGNVEMGLPIKEDITVYDLESKQVNLHQYVKDLVANDPLPVIIFAGSVS